MNGNIQIPRTKVFSHPRRKWFIFPTVLLGAIGITGALAFSELSSASFSPPETVQSLSADSGQAQKLAKAYYAKKYNDSNVDIDVTPCDDHMDAEVRKNGELVKSLSIKNGAVTEHRIGSNDWALNLLYMIN